MSTTFCSPLPHFNSSCTPKFWWSLHSAGHLTPASSPWLQLWLVMKGQSVRRASVPVQRTLSNRICPVPAPKNAWVLATALKVEKPSCLHTTLASGVPQRSSHTVPQVLLMQTSTRPSLAEVPPISLTSPLAHPWHLMPASSACTQLSKRRCGQARRVASLPVHWTLSIWMGPVPWPKKARENAWAPAGSKTHESSELWSMESICYPLSLSGPGAISHVYSPVLVYPSCAQATWASGAPQKSSHTVPHTPPMQISRRPSLDVCPLTSLRAPCVQSKTKKISHSGLEDLWDMYTVSV